MLQVEAAGQLQASHVGYIWELMIKPQTMCSFESQPFQQSACDVRFRLGVQHGIQPVIRW